MARIERNPARSFAIREVQSLRQSADRFEQKGQPVMAMLFRQDAYLLEQKWRIKDAAHIERN